MCLGNQSLNIYCNFDKYKWKKRSVAFLNKNILAF